jgi:PTS system mannose-specific IIA component/D-glucosaminate-specific PTS system IIA component
MAHGNLADEILKTAGGISGLDVSGVHVFSTCCGNDCAVISRQIEKIFSESADGTLVLSDIFGGSAANVPLQASKGRHDVAILAGLNLSMLLSALQHRANMKIAELTDKVEVDGKRSVINVVQALKGQY